MDSFHNADPNLRITRIRSKKMQIQIVNDVRTKTFVLIPGYELAFEWVLLQFKNFSLIIWEVFYTKK